MTLPAMKIWTGGDREYSERVRAAFSEYGQKLATEFTEDEWPVQALWAEPNGFMSGLYADDPDWQLFCRDESPAYRLADNGNLVPQEADDEGWIAWHGGECPVDAETYVEIVTADMSWKTNNGDAGGFFWERDRPDQIIHYRVPSQVFETSQKLERKPVHQMKHGDYILREDIPDEATFRRVCEVLEGQGVPMEDSWEALQACSRIVVSCLRAASFAGPGGNASYGRRRITPADLGITTDTQETDMTPCEKKGLREGQWVWDATGYSGMGSSPQWIRLKHDDGSHMPWFEHDFGHRFRYLSEIDWSAGIHNEKPDEGGMSETLTEAEALREVARGFDEGDANPWNRVQYLSAGDEWMDLGSPAELDICEERQTSLRRKPRTVLIEGEISEETVRRLRNLRTGGPGESLNAALDEILSAVQDQ